MISSTLGTRLLLLLAILASLLPHLHISWLIYSAGSDSMKNEFIFITLTPRWLGVEVQMFMNMNLEWIASFPGRDNYCALFHFPGTLSEMSSVTRDVRQTCLFVIVEILHIVLKQVVCTTGGGAGVWLWDRAAIWGRMAERLDCQVQRSNSKFRQWPTRNK